MPLVCSFNQQCSTSSDLLEQQSHGSGASSRFCASSSSMISSKSWSRCVHDCTLRRRWKFGIWKTQPPSDWGNLEFNSSKSQANYSNYSNYISTIDIYSNYISSQPFKTVLCWQVAATRLTLPASRVHARKFPSLPDCRRVIEWKWFLALGCSWPNFLDSGVSDFHEPSEYFRKFCGQLHFEDSSNVLTLLYSSIH